MQGLLEQSMKLQNFVLRAGWTLDTIGNNPPTLGQVFDALKGFFNTFAFALLPIALVVMIVYGGVQRLLAGDNPQNVAKANAVITWAIIGAVLLVISILLVNIISQIGSGTSVIQ